MRIKKVRTRANFEKKKHFNAAERKACLAHWLRIPVIFLNVFAASILFRQLNEVFSMEWPYVAGFLTLAGALLVALAEYCKYEKAVAGHRFYGNQFARLANSCEGLVAKVMDKAAGSEEFNDEMEKLAERYNETCALANEYPTSNSDYKAAKKGMNHGEEGFTEKELE